MESFLEDRQTRHVHNKLRGRIFQSPSRVCFHLNWKALFLLTFACHYVTIDCRNYAWETVTLMHINATEILYEGILLYLVEVL